MSADDSKIEQPRQRQSDTMSSTTQEAPKEVRPAIPAFSYAQAAKGKAPSVPANLPVSIAKSDTSETGAKKDTNAEASPILPATNNGSGRRIISEGGKPHDSDFKATCEPSPHRNATGNGAVKESTSNAESTAVASAPEMTSTFPAPNSGPISTSPLPRDDDGAPTVNGSSESTWDKHSQSSQNGSKNGEKASAAKDNAQKASEASWDEEKPEPISLKEAPPPPVNFWAQRMAQPTKAKPQQSAPLQISKPVTLANGVGGAGESARNTESGGEPRKQENKKKSKGNTEDRPTMKEGSKSAEGKTKNGEGRIFKCKYK